MKMSGLEHHTLLSIGQVTGEPFVDTPTLERALRMPECGKVSKAFDNSKDSCNISLHIKERVPVGGRRNDGLLNRAEWSKPN